MRYRVHGISRKLGSEVSMTIDAATRAEAEAIAQRTIVVAEIEEPQDPLDVEAAIVPENPGHRPALARAVELIPEYHGIEIGATVLRILAVLCILGAFCLAVAAFIFLTQPGGPAGLFAAAIFCAIANVFSAALFFLLASLSLAIRDIAINSYKTAACVSRLE